jgi:hypothetical protein
LQSHISPPMAAEGIAETTLPLPPRFSASSAPTLGALLAARASAAVTKNSGERPSLLSRILHRGRSGGFSCRLRLPLPRSCSSGAAAKEEVAAPKVVASRAEPREPPPSSSMAGTYVNALPVGVVTVSVPLVSMTNRYGGVYGYGVQRRRRCRRAWGWVRACCCCSAGARRSWAGWPSCAPRWSA